MLRRASSLRALGAQRPWRPPRLFELSMPLPRLVLSQPGKSKDAIFFEFCCLGILMFVVILRYTDMCYVDSDHEHEKLQALTQLHHFVTSLGLLHSLLSLFGLRRLIFHFCVRSCNGLTSKGMAKM